MSDDKTKVGEPDRSFINMNEDYEVRDWSEKFGVDRAALQRAVDQVGNRAEDVGAFLQGQRPG